VQQPAELCQVRGVLEIRHLRQLDADEDGTRPLGDGLRHVSARTRFRVPTREALLASTEVREA